ncbi:MAG: hypothetical protein Q9161_003680 [Pseudevernia consocians]
MESLVDDIMTAGASLAKASWEHGTAAEALIELHDPELSVFATDPFPAARIPQPTVDATPGLVYAKKYIRKDEKTLIDADGSSGDTAALGVFCILIGQSITDYHTAAKREADYLLEDVPRWSNGAISHRHCYAELWADFVYMAPPFLAYQAVATGNADLMRVAVQQCLLYSDVLQSEPERKLWKHIVGPAWMPARDKGIWATGNGWAVAGMVRVLATAIKSPYNKSDNLDTKRLLQVIFDIIDGASSAKKNGSPPLLCNYLNDGSYFGDVASTALVASAVYRLAVMFPKECSSQHIRFAESCWESVQAHINDRNGDVGPTPMPGVALSHTPSMEGSSQGHSFVVMLFAAHRDWENWKQMK